MVLPGVRTPVACWARSQRGAALTGPEGGAPDKTTRPVWSFALGRTVNAWTLLGSATVPYRLSRAHAAACSHLEPADHVLSHPTGLPPSVHLPLPNPKPHYPCQTRPHSLYRSARQTDCWSCIRLTRSRPAVAQSHAHGLRSTHPAGP